MILFYLADVFSSWIKMKKAKENVLNHAEKKVYVNLNIQINLENDHGIEE